MAPICEKADGHEGGLSGDHRPDQVCVWVYGLFTDVPGDFVKKTMKDCTGAEITQEWLYHIGVPAEQIQDLATVVEKLLEDHGILHKK